MFWHSLPCAFLLISLSPLQSHKWPSGSNWPSMSHPQDRVIGSGMGMWLRLITVCLGFIWLELARSFSFLSGQEIQNFEKQAGTCPHEAKWSKIILFHWNHPCTLLISLLHHKARIYAFSFPIPGTEHLRSVQQLWNRWMNEQGDGHFWLQVFPVRQS